MDGRQAMRARGAAFALLAACAALPLATAAPPATVRPGVWFAGDFESGDLAGWSGDLARPGSAVVVTQPVRRGRHAVRITLAPGDIAANKERAELKLADKTIERTRGGHGQTLWYGWSLLVPADHADPPGGQHPILAQWHHRPVHTPAPGRRAHVTGPPPLALYLVSVSGELRLKLVAQHSRETPGRTLAARPIRRGAWTDLVFHVRWSTGNDGSVEAWLDGRPWTAGRIPGPTLYNASSNYLRLGFYRTKGGRTTNHVYYDEVRIGESYQAVAP